MADNTVTPDPMTPAWSHALALVAHSPYWQGYDGMLRREAFVEAAAQFATYDDLPDDLKATYRLAQHLLGDTTP